MPEREGAQALGDPEVRVFKMRHGYVHASVQLCVYMLTPPFIRNAIW